MGPRACIFKFPCWSTLFLCSLTFHGKTVRCSARGLLPAAVVTGETPNVLYPSPLEANIYWRAPREGPVRQPRPASLVYWALHRRRHLHVRGVQTSVVLCETCFLLVHKSEEILQIQVKVCFNRILDLRTCFL